MCSLVIQRCTQEYKNKTFAYIIVINGPVALCALLFVQAFQFYIIRQYLVVIGVNNNACPNRSFAGKTLTSSYDDSSSLSAILISINAD